MLGSHVQGGSFGRAWDSSMLCVASLSDPTTGRLAVCLIHDKDNDHDTWVFFVAYFYAKVLSESHNQVEGETKAGLSL